MEVQSCCLVLRAAIWHSSQPVGTPAPAWRSYYQELPSNRQEPDLTLDRKTKRVHHYLILKGKVYTVSGMVIAKNSDW